MKKKNNEKNMKHSLDENNSLFVTRLAIIAILLIFAYLLWQASEIFLLVFAGILLAIFLQTFASLISKLLNLNYAVSLVLFIFTLISIVYLLLRLFAPTLTAQAALLSQEMPKAFRYLQAQMMDYFPFGVEAMKTSFSNFNVLEQVTTVFSITFGAITGMIVFLFVGIYLAFDYMLYLNGFLKLFPPGKRAIAERVLVACGETLRWWLVGQLIAMLILGTTTTIGLYLLEMPLALILGLLAGLLTFLPTLGPIIAAIPALLVAIIQGPWLVLYVALLYAAIQMTESYLVTPFIQKKTTALPPALVVVVQILMGMLAGPLGLALAAPLTAVAIVLIDQIYVKEILEK